MEVAGATLGNGRGTLEYVKRNISYVQDVLLGIGRVVIMGFLGIKLMARCKIISIETSLSFEYKMPNDHSP